MKALIAMSGGVDSSVAAYRMKEAGYDCIGCTMKLFSRPAGEEADPDERSCCSIEDVEDARAVARRLGIPYYVFNFSEEFRTEVMRRFAESYAAGRTPNPCIDCNRFLKFGKLYQRARELGCDCVATGHYARIGRDGDRYYLRCAADREKDQSYVLYRLGQDELAHTAFPLGDVAKEETRRIAQALGFVNAGKRDSQDICFVPDGDHAAAVARILGCAAPPGDFLDVGGAVLGRHEGITHYTVGQRRGLGISSTERLYVCSVDPGTNTVTLGTKAQLMREWADTEDVHWISGEAPAFPLHCRVRLRYHQTAPEATVRPHGDGVRIEFAVPQPAPAPGQAAVFYDGDTVLGGGILCVPGR